MNEILKAEIKAWKQANKELDAENLKLKYWCFVSMFINLSLALVFVYENLH